MKKFLTQVHKFNQIYKIGSSPDPVVPTSLDLVRFRSILLEELEEIDELIANVKAYESSYKAVSDAERSELLAEIADWHGDMVVYCHTHAAKFGLRMDLILDVIMESNFSKIGSDGEPIYDERGKVLKGPNFFPPEPKLKKLFSSEAV